jgi:hypothetical protein
MRRSSGTAVCRSRGGWRERLHAAFEEFIHGVVSDPGAAGLVIVEGLAVGEGAARHREYAARAFELLLRQSFERAPDGGRVAAATITAPVGGVRRIVYIHLREGRVGALPLLVDDLLDSTVSYQLSAGAEFAALRDPQRPKGTRPVAGGCGQALELPHARLRYSERERIAVAVSSLVCGAATGR